MTRKEREAEIRKDPDKVNAYVDDAYNRYMMAKQFRENCYDENKSQKDMCLDYLKQYGSITPLDALSAFSSFRLASIIYRLRKDGYCITKEIAPTGSPYAIYTLIREGEEYDG